MLSSLLISLVAVVIAVVVAWVLARRISQPLTGLAAEMERVGDFRIEGTSERDHSMFREIDMMNIALAKMKGGLRSFARYVPRDLVRAGLASGQDATLSGEVRRLTVYFSDLAGFTTLAESRAPDELVRFLGQYFDDMSQIIATERGTVDKYLGDGIMAFWGAPSPIADHAARACVAAIRSQRRLRELAPDGIKLAARIGVATGDVLVGNIGSSERLNYTVMGDTANLAARLESLNKQYGTALMIDHATYEEAKAAVVARPLDVVAVKGKQRGVRVYELLALVADDDATATAIAADSTLALDAYLARRFDDAAAAWDRVLAKRPGDRSATTMRDRAIAFAALPPGADWEGVTMVSEK
ncbi:MAG: adenylate/guanylate cyclase domain-containing protein [Myxococcota bacterium]|nr:adenylate/guanylate cyclase domain-containing protein [Myxococcota bacterium]